jgi:hypothetical protein
VNRNRPSLPARMMEESEGVGSDDVDCIRDYVCSLCPRVASARLLSAYLLCVKVARTPLTAGLSLANREMPMRVANWITAASL